MNEEQREKPSVDSTDYSCPGCDGPLVFNPTDSSLYCDYCGYKRHLDGRMSEVEYDFINGEIDESSWKQETKVFRCKNCGSLNVVSAVEICNTCPFCGSNQVLETDELPGIKPHRVVSFKIDAKAAHNAYLLKIKKNIFVPNKVKKDQITTQVVGVYLPSWTFDTETFSTYDGMLGKTYTRTVGSGKNRRVVTEIRWFKVKGSQEVKFDDILIDAGTKITSSELSALEPFDTNNSFKYDKQFLAGFVAEHYTLKLHAAWDSAKLKATEAIKKTILDRYNYDLVSYLNVKTDYDKITYKYVLLPIWIGLFKYRNKDYRFLVNGTNDKRIKASVPVSPLKVTFFVLFIIIVVAIFIILISIGETNQ